MKKYHAPQSLDAAYLFNGALASVRKDLRDNNIVFSPNVLFGSTAEVQAGFRKEFARAEALRGAGKLDKNLCGFSAAAGLVEAVEDSHTTFIPPTPDGQEDIFQKLPGGIGTVLDQQNGMCYVELVISASPAEQAGIRRLDRLMSVNGLDVRGESDLESVVKLIRGPVGTMVEVGIERNRKPMKFQLKRKEIPMDTELPYKVELIGGPNGSSFIYFPIYKFINNPPVMLPSDFWSKYEDLRAKGVVLDLRNNPGGALDAIKCLVAMFFDEPLVFLGHISRRQNTETLLAFSHFCLDVRDGSFVRQSVPLVVLVNRNSASGSEIVAAVLQEHERAKLVGTITSGETNVSRNSILRCGAFIKIAEEEYSTPVLNKKIEKQGVYPDYYVELTTEDILCGQDSQMQKALEILEGEVASRKSHKRFPQTQTQPAPQSIIEVELP